MRIYKSIILSLLVLACILAAAPTADARWSSRATRFTTLGDSAKISESDSLRALPVDSSLICPFPRVLTIPYHPFVEPVVDLKAIDKALKRKLPKLDAATLAPTVFAKYYFPDSMAIGHSSGHTLAYPQAAQWLFDEQTHMSLTRNLEQLYMMDDPTNARYIAEALPRTFYYTAPTVDPKDQKLSTEGLPNESSLGKVTVPVDIKLKHWLHTFESALQFSQSYISPNWYQGGVGNVNSIGQVAYNIKLNQTLHPKLMFETSIDYKLALNNAPDDSIHGYNISEDLFRVTSKFGIKAFDKWYYSVNVQFKTQLLNSYKKNSNDLQSSFLSPGELNVGVGMTYNYANKKKTVTFDASMSPLSYNMKSCITSRIEPATFGIEAGHKIVNQFGSSGEGKFKWQISKNILYKSRFYIFTNYKYVQSDWENTLSFEINRFLSTQVFAHLRYDSGTTPPEGTKWKKWQFKEVLSIGFSYRFTDEIKKK